jgi:hypothetical protein
VSNVLDALFDVVRSRSETQMNLVFRGSQRLPDEELAATQKQLDASAQSVVEAFFERAEGAGDPKDSLVLAALEAAGEYLVGFLELENKCLCEYLGALATHLELKCNGQPRQTRRRSRSRTK